MPLDRTRPVAVIDDDEDQRELVGEMLRDQGVEPYLVRGPVKTVRGLVQRVMHHAGAAICDHRLADKAFATFTGAEATAELIRRRVPTVLLTQFLSIDSDVSIRRWREFIPVALPRDQVSGGATLVTALEEAMSELESHGSARSGTQTCILTVRAVDREGGQRVFDVSIAGWKADIAVRLPLILVPRSLRPMIRKGAVLTAEVNTDVEDATEIFFRNFGKAPPRSQRLLGQLRSP